MATRFIKASGGDYTSLSAWEASLPATLTAVEQAECDDFAISDNVAFSGSVTSAANYIRVYTLPAARHDGRSRAVSGKGFRITDTSGSWTIRIADNHVRFEGIEIEQTGANGAFQSVSTLAAGSDIRIEQCIIHDTATGSAYTMVLAAPNLNATIRNSVVYGSQRTWDTRGAASVLAENCTFWRHQAQLGTVSGGELTLKNSYSGHTGTGSSDYLISGTGQPTGNNNASSDATATTMSTASINSVAGSAVFVSVTVGAEDFTIKTGANALVDAGATLASTPTDLIGTARPQGSAYDIGARERLAAGPAAITGALAATLSNATLTASGAVVNAGAFAATLSAATMTASGTVGAAPAGALASTLGPATMTAAGAVTNAGSFASTLGGASMAAAGTIDNRGVMAATLGSATMAAAGAVAPNITGTMSSTLAGATMTAYGYNGVPPVLAGYFQRLPKTPRHVQKLP